MHMAGRLFMQHASAAMSGKLLTASETIEQALLSCTMYNKTLNFSMMMMMTDWVQTGQKVFEFFYLLYNIEWNDIEHTDEHR